MANEEHLAILRQGVEAWNKWRKDNSDVRPDLREADLILADLRGAKFSEADLGGAHLSNAGLNGADLSAADLGGADLSAADLSAADLTGADLTGAYLRGADLSRAQVLAMMFADVDLSEVKGLDTVNHEGPSTIGIDTIYKSKGQIPEVFLRGCGVPDEFITFMHSLVATSVTIVQSGAESLKTA